MAFGYCGHFAYFGVCLRWLGLRFGVSVCWGFGVGGCLDFQILCVVICSIGGW